MRFKTLHIFVGMVILLGLSIIVTGCSGNGGTATAPDVSHDSQGSNLIAVEPQADVPVSATNSAEVFALLETSGAGTLLYTTDVSGIQQVTDGNTMTFGTWDVEILDPTP